MAKSLKYADVETVVWKLRRQVVVNKPLKPSLETGRQWKTKWVFKVAIGSMEDRHQTTGGPTQVKVSSLALKPGGGG